MGSNEYPQSLHIAWASFRNGISSSSCWTEVINHVLVFEKRKEKEQEKLLREKERLQREEQLRMKREYRTQQILEVSVVFYYESCQDKLYVVRLHFNTRSDKSSYVC